MPEATVDCPWLSRDYLTFSWFRAPFEQVRRDVLRTLTVQGLGRSHPVEQELTDLPFDLPEQRYATVGLFITLWEPASAAGDTLLFPLAECGSFAQVFGEEYDYEFDTVRVGASRPGWDVAELSVHSRGEMIRIVRSMRGDTRWEFLEIGEPQTWEKTEQYRERLVEKRVTRELLQHYFEVRGLPVADPATWTSDQSASRIEWTRPGPR